VIYSCVRLFYRGRHRLSEGKRNPSPKRLVHACARIGITESLTWREQKLADEKLYKAESQGSGTFIISKPKRKKTKRRQTKLKNPRTGMR